MRAVAVVLERGELPRRPRHLGRHSVVEHSQGGVPRKLSFRIGTLHLMMMMTLDLGAGQTKEFCSLLDVFIPRIYRIFRASQNANR